jgi:hypothetical protein
MPVPCSACFYFSLTAFPTDLSTRTDQSLYPAMLCGGDQQTCGKHADRPPCGSGYAKRVLPNSGRATTLSPVRAWHAERLLLRDSASTTDAVKSGSTQTSNF